MYVDEYVFDIGEQLNAVVGVVGLPTQIQAGRPRQFRPGPAGGVGDRDQRLPRVLLAVLDRTQASSGSASPRAANPLALTHPCGQPRPQLEQRARCRGGYGTGPPSRLGGGASDRPTTPRSTIVSGRPLIAASAHMANVWNSVGAWFGSDAPPHRAITLKPGVEQRREGLRSARPCFWCRTARRPHRSAGWGSCDRRRRWNGR